VFSRKNIFIMPRIMEQPREKERKRILNRPFLLIIYIDWRIGYYIQVALHMIRWWWSTFFGSSQDQAKQERRIYELVEGLSLSLSWAIINNPRVERGIACLTSIREPVIYSVIWFVCIQIIAGGIFKKAWARIYIIRIQPFARVPALIDAC
jgi:hypothetical protein